jgi:hypothetical protein
MSQQRIRIDKTFALFVGRRNFFLICGGFFLKIFFLFERNFLILLPTQFEKYV